MNNRLFIITINFIVGLIWGLYFNISIALFLGIIVIISCILFRKYKDIIFPIVMILACIYAWVVKKDYDCKYNEIDICNIEGIVVENPSVYDYSLKYKLKVLSVNGQKKYSGTNLVVKQKKLPKDDNAENIQCGDFISICNGGFSYANKSRNYRGFDYNIYLRSKKIYGMVNADYSSVRIKRKKYSNSCYVKFYKTRQNLEEKIFSMLQQKSAEVCSAILLGDKECVDENIIDMFSEANLSHVLAVSGMHVNYIVIIVSVVCKFIGKRKQKYTIIIFLICYSLLVGNSFSVMRAVIMVIYYMIANLIHRRPDVIKGICISSIIILINNPYAIVSSSFLLSFLATLSIVLFQDKVKKAILPNVKSKFLSFVKESVCLSISANILILPVLLITNHKFSFVFIISNIVISIILPIILPLSIVCLIVSFFYAKLAFLIGIPLNWLFSLMLNIINFFSSLKWLNIWIKRPLDITIIVYYLMCILNSMKERFRDFNLYKKIIKCLVILYVIATIVNGVNGGVRKELSIYVIDVGQGDCTLVYTKGKKAILVDGGGSEKEDYVGNNILLPYLLNRRIKCIDCMIISHFDSDHVQGLFAILENLKVKKVIISKQGKECENLERFRAITQKKNIKVETVEKGKSLKIENDLYLDFLWPDNQNMISENILNNNSVVFNLHYKSFSMLFTGDIEQIAESEILSEYSSDARKLKSTILKVGHHGSNTSSSEDFIKTISPKIAVIGVGQDNKFGHPNDEVIDRLRSHGIKIYRTDKMGEIIISVDKKGKIQIKKHL